MSEPSDTLRIAQLAPLAEAVPPKLYGGTERVVSYLTEELVALGHDVTLFASGDSRTSGRLVPITPRALRLDPSRQDGVAPVLVLLHHVLRRAAEFDVIHVHLDHLHLPAFQSRQLPFLTTLHGRLDLPELVPLFDAFADAPFVSISDAQRRAVRRATWLGTVHHGLPRDLLPFKAKPGGYLAFVGRIAPEKGPDRAIRIAVAAGMALKLAAKIGRPERAYFRSAVEPLLGDPGIEFVGEISEREKGDFLGNAAALLFPVDWPEPFGLAMIEAIACGTPVIAFDRGSVREVIDDGVTGFIVEDERSAVEAVGRLGELGRGRVRATFERRFTSRRMAQDYLALYRAIARIEPRAPRPCWRSVGGGPAGARVAAARPGP
jgi:glycosyltransferase involved in cell wall biosynthesis